jgi:PAS domain S-box-containing protein
VKTAARYSFALVAMLAAIALTALLAELIAPMRLFFLWSAVLITAVAAGVGPALLSVALSVIVAAYLVFDPIGPPGVFGIDILRVSLFGAFAAGISLAVGMRRRAEERAAGLSEELRQRELRYRTLVEATPVSQAVWTATPDGRIEWSDEWLAITGQKREEVESGGGMHVVHPEDGPRTWERWSRALASQTYYEDEIRVCANGRYRWFAIKAVPVRGPKGVREWVGNIVDIDARKRHEENAIFINRASEVLASSLGYEETMRNLARLCVPAIGDWCGIDIAEGESYQRLVVEHADVARMQLLRELDQYRPAPDVDPIMHVIRSGKSQLVEHLTDDMLEALSPSREQFELAKTLGLRSWIIAPMTTRGKTLGALTVVHGDSGRRYFEEDVPFVEDLARRAAMALDNARLYEAAEAANRAKDEFLATLSHELRTPLTAIAGWAHMLQLGTDEATMELAVDTIVRSAKAQGELIDDLLDLSRVVAGTLHLNVVTVDLAQLIDEVAVAVRPAADAKALQLELASVPAVLVRGDERRLRQVIWNLVTNAVKFTEEGGSVRLALGVSGNHARVEVRDSGRGIDPSFLPYVWDRFRQADSSTSRQHGGLGLGLSVVRHLVELHGGTVHAESAGVGKGATFVFELPLARLADAAGAAARSAARDDKPLRDRRVLVVDDDKDARLVISTMLRQAGANVDAASSVEEAMKLIKTKTFDVIVSDIAMPGEDGYSLVRRTRLASSAPIIAVSAIATGGDDRRRALDAGFADFVRKPVDPRQLAVTVSAAIRR